MGVPVFIYFKEVLKVKKSKKVFAAATVFLLIVSGFSLFARAEAAETVGDYIVSSGYDQGIMISKYIGSETDVIVPSELTLSSGVTLSVFGIGESAFASNHTIKSVTLPDSVTYIGQEAFSDCINIDNFVFGGVEEIGISAFSSCEALKEIRLPDSLKVLGAGAFQYCSLLESADTGDGIETITGGSFSRCEKLFSVTIGKSVTTIAENAFLGSRRLEDVRFNDKASNISQNAFDSEFTGVIYCYFGSAAELYAREGSYEYENYVLSGTVAEGPDKTVYYEGESVSTAGLKVTASYENAPAREVTENCTVNTAYYDDEDGHFIEVVYTELSKSITKYIPLTFKRDSITGISIIKPPDTLTYRYKDNQGVSLKGIKLEVSHESGKKETVSDTELMTVSGFNSTKRGSQSLSVAYGGKTASFDVEVKVLWWQWILLIFLFGWIWYK